MVKYLTQEEERRLSEAGKGRYAKRDRLILIFAVNTGLRVSELCALTLIDAMNGKIKNELEVGKEVAKSKRARVIPLNSRAKKAIGDLLAWNEARRFKQGPGTRLLRSQKRKAMTRQQVDQIIRCAGGTPIQA